MTDGTESATDDEPGSTDLADGNEFETDDGQEWQYADWHDAEPALDAADRKADDDWIASSAEPGPRYRDVGLDVDDAQHAPTSSSEQHRWRRLIALVCFSWLVTTTLASFALSRC